MARSLSGERFLREGEGGSQKKKKILRGRIPIDNRGCSSKPGKEFKPAVGKKKKPTKDCDNTGQSPPNLILAKMKGKFTCNVGLWEEFEKRTLFKKAGENRPEKFLRGSRHRSQGEK